MHRFAALLLAAAVSTGSSRTPLHPHCRIGFVRCSAGIIPGDRHRCRRRARILRPGLLAGLGIGALASQLGSVTVSSVPDEQSGEVGGVQNTVTNLGASIGTALAGAVLISVLTTSFLSGVQNNPDVPKNLASQTQVELAGGVPFLSDKDLKTQLDKAGVPPKTADAIVEENANARIAGLRASMSVLAIFALMALFASRRIPTRQPSDSRVSESSA